MRDLLAQQSIPSSQPPLNAADAWLLASDRRFDNLYMPILVDSRLIKGYAMHNYYRSLSNRRALVSVLPISLLAVILP
ncbi:hypothetical protein [Idiomarina xiamenensis]|uniref:Uncharacterized protein n=1 Tax=Idiomarina xiamenensis 10-D-4 TaxID=740709 RepID=K2KHY2_9GAMM|nr:hypothetical protein [Idiomarina xiamenensis]EKE87553.1 hypothetical protein A10D4_00625 [Idiomarina xiamenensis 10-D-4]